MLTGWTVHFDEQERYGKLRGDDRHEYFVHREDLIEVVGASDTPSRAVP